MTEPETYERVGAAAGLVGIIVGLHKIGTWRGLWRWINRGRIRDEALRADLMARHDALFLLIQHATESYDKNTAELKQIRMAMTGMKDAIEQNTDETRIFSAAATIALNESRTPRWIINEKMDCIDCNEALEELFRLPRDKILKQGWQRRIRSGQLEGVAKELQRVYDSNGKFPYKWNYTLDFDDGTSLTVQAKGVEVVTSAATGKIIRMFGVCVPLDTHAGFHPETERAA